MMTLTLQCHELVIYCKVHEADMCQTDGQTFQVQKLRITVTKLF